MEIRGIVENERECILGYGNIEVKGRKKEAGMERNLATVLYFYFSFITWLLFPSSKIAHAC